MNRRDLLIIGAGTAVAWSLAARAQQKAVPVIGVFSSGSPGPLTPGIAAFHQGLSETGYVEGQNVVIEYHGAEGRNDRLPAVAADIVERKVDVIYSTSGVAGARAAKNATATIPIVFVIGADPVATGLVASLARPGGNLTGFTIFGPELNAKRFELLSELVPQARVFAVLIDPTAWTADFSVEQMSIYGTLRAKGMQLHLVKAAGESGLEPAFAKLAELQVGGLMVSADPIFFRLQRPLAAAASRFAVPTICVERGFIDAGGLISYGASGADIVRRAGIYVGRILKGEKPADLPVQQPAKFELVINLKTAQALGLTVPQSLLARADEVIE